MKAAGIKKKKKKKKRQGDLGPAKGVFGSMVPEERPKLTIKAVLPKADYLITCIMTLMQTDIYFEISPLFLSSTHSLIMYRYQPLTPRNWVMQGLLRNEGRCSRYGRGCLVTGVPCDRVARAGLEQMRGLWTESAHTRAPEKACLLAPGLRAARACLSSAP